MNKCSSITAVVSGPVVTLCAFELYLGHAQASGMAQILAVVFLIPTCACTRMAFHFAWHRIGFSCQYMLCLGVKELISSALQLLLSQRGFSQLLAWRIGGDPAG